MELRTAGHMVAREVEVGGEREREGGGGEREREGDGERGEEGKKGGRQRNRYSRLSMQAQLFISSFMCVTRSRKCLCEYMPCCRYFM